MAAVLHSEGTLPGMHAGQIFVEASQNLELFAKILPSNENNTAAGMAWPGILCQQRRQIFQQVQSCFHLSCQPGKDVASSI